MFPPNTPAALHLAYRRILLALAESSDEPKLLLSRDNLSLDDTASVLSLDSFVTCDTDAQSVATLHPESTIEGVSTSESSSSHSAFRLFLEVIPDGGAWKCLFECEVSEITGLSQALDHIAIVHFSLQRFRCNGQCGAPSW